MKWLRVGLLFFVIYGLFLTPDLASAQEAVTYTPPKVLEDSPLIISAYNLKNPNVPYVQIYNTADYPIDLNNWHVVAVAKDDSKITLGELKGWILPNNYVLAGVVDGADFLLERSVFMVASLQLESSSDSIYEPHVVGVDKDGEYRRKTSAKTGEYLSTFELSAQATLYGGGIYSYPVDTGLVFSEILPNPRICSPLEQALDCGDYVKIFNPTTSVIDLSAFRLRVGYKGQTSSSSNTYLLSGLLEPAHFALINQDADGQNVGVTNGGGYVWLEDAYGIKQYDSTVQYVGDASAESKRGFAWAYDASDGMWKWTTQPNPGDSPSVFPVQAEKVTVAATKEYTPCEAGEYRSEDTHRCRSLASLITSTLAPCPAGQYRSEETNRCRKAEVAPVAQLCPEGQERNPETNRCRKISEVLAASDFTVDPAKETEKAFSSWWMIGGLGALAVGYGAWEWRHEVVNLFIKIGTFFTSGK